MFKNKYANIKTYLKVYWHFIHSGFNSSNKSPLNDIALLHLKEPLKFNQWVAPVHLSSSNKINSNLIVAGWGYTDTLFSIAYTLQHGNAQLRDTCPDDVSNALDETQCFVVNAFSSFSFFFYAFFFH